MPKHHSWYRLEDGCREQRSRKAHSPNDIMNPKGVPTKGMWRKVFVKALPNRISQINSCLAVSLPDNICISNAQYYELNALRNLWCEILEFWAFRAISLIHSRLCNLWEKCVNERVVKVALLRCHSACFTIQYFNYCLAIAPLWDCKSSAMRPLWGFWWLARMALML